MEREKQDFHGYSLRYGIPMGIDPPPPHSSHEVRIKSTKVSAVGKVGTIRPRPVHQAVCQECDWHSRLVQERRYACLARLGHYLETEGSDMSFLQRSFSLAGAKSVLTSIVLWAPVSGYIAVELLDVIADVESGALDLVAAALVILGIISRVSPVKKGESGLA